MPERHGYKIEGGAWASGTDVVNGISVPQTLNVDSRNNNLPPEYKASLYIDFINEYTDAGTDEYVAYIADGSTITNPGNTGGSGGANNVYRYGFNGKENDDEVKGVGNELDYGDRLYDTRLGRWLSIDPMQKKYPNWSPYNYVLNSPLKLQDKEGKDVGVAIVGENITFTSTIFITGPGASDVATKANAAMNTLQNCALQTRTYTDNAGNCYNVQFKINFVAVNPEDKSDPNYNAYNATKEAKVETNPNNIVSLEALGSSHLASYEGSTERNRSNAGSYSNPKYNQKLITYGKNSLGVEQQGWGGLTNVSGNLAYVYEGDKTIGATTVHETFHLLGLGDRYIERRIAYTYTYTRNGKTVQETVYIKTFQKGFKIDIMNQSSLNGFSQVHIDNLVKAALNKQKETGQTEFILSQKVDGSYSTQTDNPDPNPYPGYTLPNK